MANVDKLRKRAAEFESKRQMDKAVAMYLELFAVWDANGGTDADVALYNRVGDMLLRDGNVGDAMSVWEQAVEYYADRGFHNNAIALCNKILRHSPGRSSVYYKLGKYSAIKGFRADAKKNFLEYADRMQKAQHMDEAFRALKEFADLCPDEDDIRQMLADQFAKLGRNEEAIEQLQLLYERYESTGQSAEAAATVDRMKAIDPEVEPKRARPSAERQSTGLVFLDLDEPAPRASRKSFVTPAPPPPRTTRSATSPVKGMAGLPLIDLESPEPTPEVEPVAGLEPTAADSESEPAEQELPHEATPSGSQPVVADITFGASFGTDEAAPGDADTPSIDIEPTSLGEDVDPTVSSSLGTPVDASFGTTPSDASETPLSVDPGLESPFGTLDIAGSDAAATDADAAPEPLDLESPFADLGAGVETADAAAGAAVDATAGASDVSDMEVLGPLDELAAEPVAGTAAEPVEEPVVEAPLEEAVELGDETVPSAEGAAVTAADDIAVDDIAVDDIAVDDIAVDDIAADDMATDDTVADDETLADDVVVDSDEGEDIGADLAEELESVGVEGPPLRGTRTTLATLAMSVDALRERAEREATNWQVRRELGEALLEDGDRDGGIAALEAAMAGFETEDDLESARSVADELILLNPNSVRHHQKRVEFAFRMNNHGRLVESYLDLAGALFLDGQTEKSRAVYLRVVELAPDDVRAQAALSSFPEEAAPPPAAPASADAPRASRRYTAATPLASEPVDAPASAAPPSDDFVDLGDWLREDEGPKSTRMVVEEQEPTGDEDADFSDMLRKFKQGVAANVDEEDYDSHYDLGVAYKEMGLVDEAISEFQKALRGTANRVRAYEALGQCFSEKGQEAVAMTILQRALSEPGVGDDQLVGVLYLLGHAAESLDQPANARAYYQRVFAVDINFRDVRARMQALDQAGT